MRLKAPPLAPCRPATGLQNIRAMVRMGCCRPLRGHALRDPLGTSQSHRHLAGWPAGHRVGASGRSSQLPPLVPLCRVPGQGQQPFSTELSVHSTATKRAFVPNRKNKRQRQLCVSLQACTAGLERETSFPRRPVCPSGCNHRCVHTATQRRSCVVFEFPGMWQGAHHTHGTHPHTHTQNATNCCPAQQGCESRAATARGLRKTSDQPAPSGAITLLFFFSRGATQVPGHIVLSRAHGPFLRRTLGSIRERPIPKKSVLPFSPSSFSLFPCNCHN